MNPPPFIPLYDISPLTEAQRTSLVLLQITEMRAELRAQTAVIRGLREVIGKPVSSEQFDKMLNQCQDDVIQEINSHIRQIAAGPQKPGLQ